ncbi:MAG: DNA cytosine methyltransferase [Scytonema sp. PMC 1069.18]|nr:DNA cytosine methyltransferase [Scytonema sp. PMC 1069.18]MEC4879851.1 DNA cytosine methyltransferase [Scytonema sp. PMC 1070.18]
MENVANLKGVGGGTLYQEIVQRMEASGYEVTVGVLVAADYGTPQLRQRLFFLGSRKGLGKIQLPYPTHSSTPDMFTQPYVTVGEAFKGLPALP